MTNCWRYDASESCESSCFAKSGEGRKLVTISFFGEWGWKVVSGKRFVYLSTFYFLLPILLIAYSANAVIVSDGLTPGLAGMIEPSII
jgi:hypothetical protein